MGALFGESKRLGESLDGEKLTGSPEMEYASSLLDKPGMRDEYQRLSAEAGPACPRRADAALHASPGRACSRRRAPLP